MERIDIITGGFPCQEISTAGDWRNAGVALDGERSGLWSEMFKAIGSIRPRYAVVENVAALTYRGLGRILGDLASIGYDAEWHIVRASDIGAPHGRSRIWIIAYPRGHLGVCWLFTKNHVQEAKQASQAQWRTNREFSEMASLRPEILEAWVDKSRSARMDDGVRAWPHRLKCLGNAVVPQIVEQIGKAIGEGL